MKPKKTLIAKQFVIDVSTKAKATLIRRLEKLSWVDVARDGGVYREDPTISQVHVQARCTEGDLDHWLRATKGIDYVDVRSRHALMF